MDQAALQRITLVLSSFAPCWTAWGARAQQSLLPWFVRFALAQRLPNLPTLWVSGAKSRLCCWTISFRSAVTHCRSCRDDFFCGRRHCLSTGHHTWGLPADQRGIEPPPVVCPRRPYQLLHRDASGLAETMTLWKHLNSSAAALISVSIFPFFRPTPSWLPPGRSTCFIACCKLGLID